MVIMADEKETEITTITISKKTREKLEQKKIIPQEPMENVIQRLLEEKE